jgi:indolepyruvate ferredoxin oxidoreductase
MDIGFAATTTLDSRYVELDQPVLMSGTQALVRVLLEQARLDRAAGLTTGGLVSGYRGSPLGGLDQELWRREKLLTAQGVRFQPGLNEDLAATMLWGTQQIDTFPGKRVDGVFGMWYGKGPGVDRSADALRCANMIGTSRLGGVLAVSGDDHAAHSSVFPHQTDGIFESVQIPVLQPADVGEILDYGLAGIAMSRYAGLWVALKTIAETAEQSAVVVVPSVRSFARPDRPLPVHGLNLDPQLPWPAERAELERRMTDERLPAARAWVRANRLDRVMHGRADAPIGIVTVGKGHHDLMHALRRLGLDGHPDIAVYKVALSWPLETKGVREFARGKRAILVVEEKRANVEIQLRSTLYNLADRPGVEGKQDHEGAPLLPATMELSPELAMAALARFLPRYGIEVCEQAVAAAPVRVPGLLTRAPTFCAGCPHGTSTRLPDGSFGMAGIGCHTMALTTSDGTKTFSQMGGEGVPWVGLSSFTDTPHMFANMGDGTYQHSGLLAIRQAVAAGAPMTYKILYNDAVAMTGGQPAEGGPTVRSIAQQLAAEGVGLIAVVADDTARLPAAADLPPGTLRHGRDDLDAVQRRMREHPGVTAIIYDQVCATEKRRRRKRGKLAAAETRVVINERVCENCGDCTAVSNCIAIEPVETDYGRKRRISPTSCNTDLSCLKGFCPSFVTAKSDAPAAEKAGDSAAEWAGREAELAAELPEPVLADAAAPWRGLFAGIGGGGIVTCGALVAMAAHLEGRHVSTLDFTGLAQKNGAVVSHVQIANAALDVVRIPRGTADLLLAADMAVGAGPDVLGRCSANAAVIGNLDLQAGAGFMRDRDLRVDAGLHRRAIGRATSVERSRFLRGSALSERLFGNAQAMNTLLLGIAWQQGLLPVGNGALMRAMELNGTAVALNRRAFLWGRILAMQPALADAIMADTAPAADTLDAVIARREAELVDYQGQALAHRFRSLVNAARTRETALAGAPGALTRAVTEGFFRVLAYKDEYEVARLHAAATYGDTPVFHMAPPLVSRPDPTTGRRRKVAISGRIALPLFRVLRHGKVLRGTVFDPFGWQRDRRLERTLAAEYERDVRRAFDRLRPDTLDAAVELAALPQDIRGFGPIKAASLEAAQPRRQALLDRLEAPTISTAAVGVAAE